MQEIKTKRALELGCGLGHYTNRIDNFGFGVLGVDVYKT
jgi:hypothetical protein